MIETLLRWRAEIADELAAVQASLETANAALQEAETKVQPLREASKKLHGVLLPLTAEGLATPLFHRHESFAEVLRIAEQHATNSRLDVKRITATLNALHAALAQLNRLIPAPDVAADVDVPEQSDRRGGRTPSVSTAAGGA